MQRQVLEGFDLGSLPTALLGPVDGQHVIRKLLSEHQAGRLGLGPACGAAFHDQIGRLRNRERRSEGRSRRDRSKAGDRYQ